MARRNRSGLTYEEHAALGPKIKEACRLLDQLSLVDRRAQKASATLNAYRSVLDSDLCQLLPLSDDRWKGVYYGNSTN